MNTYYIVRLSPAWSSGGVSYVAHELTLQGRIALRFANARANATRYDSEAKAIAEARRLVGVFTSHTFKVSTDAHGTVWSSRA